MNLKIVFCALALSASLTLAGEDQATNGYKAFRNATVITIVQEFTGKIGIKLGNKNNLSEYYWLFLDPSSQGLDYCNMLLSTLLTAQANEKSVDAIYWGTDSELSYSFQGVGSMYLASRRLHSIFINSN